MTMAPTTVNDEGLKNSLMFSGGIHLLLLLFLYFGLPRLFTPPPTHHAPVPFEIVDVSELTNTRVKEPEPQVKPPEPPPPPPQPKAEEPQVTAPPPAPKPPEPKVEALKPSEVPKPKPKPPETKKVQEDFTKLLRNLAVTKKTTPKTEETKADSKTTAQTQAASQAPSLSTRLTISEEDALRRQIAQCWNMPIGARDAQSLIVTVSIDVNPDRTVRTAEVVDKVRMATDSFYRAASEAALRALFNPNCSPLELPADKYDQWKHIEFTFDPRDML